MKFAAVTIFVLLLLSASPALAEGFVFERIDQPEVQSTIDAGNPQEIDAGKPQVIDVAEFQDERLKRIIESADEEWRRMPFWKKTYVKTMLVVIPVAGTAYILNEFFKK